MTVCPQQSVVKVLRRTETGDAAPVECSGTFTTGCQETGGGGGLVRRPSPWRRHGGFADLASDVQPKPWAPKASRSTPKTGVR